MVVVTHIFYMPLVANRTLEPLRVAFVGRVVAALLLVGSILLLARYHDLGLRLEELRRVRSNVGEACASGIVYVSLFLVCSSSSRRAETE